MFNKNKDSGEITPNGTDTTPPLKPFSRNANHGPASAPTPAVTTTDPSRRLADIPSAVRRVDRPRSGIDSESKKLTVGKDICLKGEITSCDKLVVEGRVEATMEEARMIEVTASGFFKGSVIVTEADISGRFEGDLTATDQLIVRAGGKVNGTIRYGKIVIESGGEIAGDMASLSAD